jgi:transcriptional regulator with XRE-family HTH domain
MAPRSRQHQALGRAFREAREKAGLTQVELAEKAGVPDTYVSDIERGVRNPTYEVLLQLSRALGVKLSQIIRRAGS